MSDLLKTVSTTFPPVLNGHLAARLGVSVHSMQRALQGAVPVMLSGLIAVATKNAALVYELCQEVQPAQAGVTGVLVILGSRDAADSALIQGDRLLKAAFGASEQTIISELSQYANLQPNLVRRLLELVGTSLLGTLGKHAAQHTLTAADITAVLTDLKRQVKALLPRELGGLVEILGLRPASRWNTTPTATAYAVIQQAAAQPTRAQWYIVAMGILLMTGAGLAAFGTMRLGRTARQAEQVAPAQAEQVVTTVATDSPASLRINF